MQEERRAKGKVDGGKWTMGRRHEVSVYNAFTFHLLALSSFRCGRGTKTPEVDEDAGSRGICMKPLFFPVLPFFEI